MPTEERRANVIDVGRVGCFERYAALALNVSAQCYLRFVALIAMINGILGWLGGFVGNEDLTMQLLFGFIFQPLAFIIGLFHGKRAQVAE